jgi:adenine phosphoribosyltransferase
MPVDLKAKVHEVPDFPTPGISFKDIMPLLGDRNALRETVDRLGDWGGERDPEVVVGGEARGFFIGSAIAYKLGCGFVPARRPGKLPRDVISAEYELEYGRNTLELQTDSIRAGTRVLIHDDVLATGGTAKAMAHLVEQLGGVVVGHAFIIELAFLEGRKALEPYDIYSLITY